MSICVKQNVLGDHLILVAAITIAWGEHVLELHESETRLLVINLVQSLFNCM